MAHRRLVVALRQWSIYNKSARPSTACKMYTVTVSHNYSISGVEYSPSRRFASAAVVALSNKHIRCGDPAHLTRQSCIQKAPFRLASKSAATSPDKPHASSKRWPNPDTPSATLDDSDEDIDMDIYDDDGHDDEDSEDLSYLDDDDDDDDDDSGDSDLDELDEEAEMSPEYTGDQESNSSSPEERVFASGMDTKVWGWTNQTRQAGLEFNSIKDLKGHPDFNIYLLEDRGLGHMKRVPDEGKRQSDTEGDAEQASTGSAAATWDLELDRFTIKECLQQLYYMGAEDISVVEMTPDQSDIAEYMVIVSSDSIRRLRAMAQHLRKLYNSANQLKGIGRAQIEGYTNDHWMILRTADTIIHFQLPVARQYYKLEEIWTAPDDDGSAQES